MSVQGLGEIALCDIGTLASTPNDAVAMGIRSKAKLIAADAPVELYRGQEGRNLVGRRIDDLETNQPTMFMLKKVIEWSRDHCDIQALSLPQSIVAGSEDVFKFIGNNRLGIDFEYMITQDKRTLKIMPRGQIEYEDHITFIDAADSDSAVDLGFSNEGRDKAKYKHPWFLAVESPKATDLFTRFNYKSREFMIKSVSEALAYDIPKAHYVEFTGSFVIEDASISEVVAIMNKDNSPSFLLKEKNNAAGTLYEAFDIAAGFLTMKVDPLTLGDDQRDVTVKFKGEIPLNKVLNGFAFGDGKGGETVDTIGTTGGTIAIT